MALLSPAVLIMLFAAFLWHTFATSKSETDEQMWRSSFSFAIALYIVGIGTAVAFLAGLCMHAYAAARTKLSCRWAWWYSLAIGVIAALLIRPMGTIIGGLLIVLLFSAKPFHIMRLGVEQSARTGIP